MGSGTFDGLGDLGLVTGSSAEVAEPAEATGRSPVSPTGSGTSGARAMARPP